MNQPSTTDRSPDSTLPTRVFAFLSATLPMLVMLPILIVALPGALYYWRRNLALALLGFAIYYPLLFVIAIAVGISPTEVTFFLAFALIVFFPRYLPPHFRYLSRRKRCAMQSVVAMFTSANVVSPDLPNCRIYRTDDHECIVVIPHHCDFLPKPLSFYSVPHNSGIPQHIGTGQCAWGIRPEHIWIAHKTGHNK